MYHHILWIILTYVEKIYTNMEECTMKGRDVSLHTSWKIIES